jgi:hypothetical protein
MSIILDLDLNHKKHIDIESGAFFRLPCQPLDGSFPNSHNKSVDTILNAGLIAPFTISRMNLGA